MRINILHEGAHFLEYEIRKIVEYAYRIRELGQNITWENIGDPVTMQEEVAPWIKNIVQELVQKNLSWGYCPTKGVLATREFLAGEVNKRGGVQVTSDDIIFFNGVADAIDKVYELLHRNARVLLPTPVYSTHSSNESKRGAYLPLQFRLDPKNGWLPDMDEIRRMIKYNPQIAGIGLVNPDNPTGLAYPREILEEFVEIARKNRLFLIVDEIYIHMCFQKGKTQHLSEFCGDVPGIALRGISKEYPWPGARCAWMEVLNRHKDSNFSEYIDSILNAKMLEVCATTLPQMSIPAVFGAPNYQEHLKNRAEIFRKRAEEAYEIFSKVPGVICTPPAGAFYFSVVFEEGVLKSHQQLPIKNQEIKKYVDHLCKNTTNDKRFAYQLLGAEGICVVPLSGFSTDLEGFRVTLLNTDDKKRRETFSRIAQAIQTFIQS
ncbi:MAG: pyridoxal phosphate-dependent aminotransferase [Planctomycetia bacterium]|nr:pyridoxal phosphate-dependent aminotransferase [Planctomycetia bacterium]